MSTRSRPLAVLAALCVALGLTTASPAAQATQADPAQPSAPGQLHVQFPSRTVTDAAGNTMLADAQGRVMQLHGANLGKTDDITEADVADMAAAGLTLL